jgi:serine/threonine-protein kinase
MSFDPAGIELTQKIDVDRKAVIGDAEKEALISSIMEKQKDSEASATGSLTGKSVFTRKRITDDYVKSSSLLSTIDSIPPLEDELQLQDVNYNYELKDKFSEGSQGIIRTAFDKSLKRHIVVKSLKVDDEDEHAKKDANLFVSEARIMAQLDHPSIIPLYGLHCGTESKLHLAMKHIHGKTLQKYLKDIILLYEREGVAGFDEKRSISNRIEYLIKVCEAVDYAHCKGVIHRDLKPENIMIGNYGEVYVMDWGLACLMKPGGKTCAKSSKDKVELVGTPCYIAPELIKGSPCSPQSDIFSLGMILFDIVTLHRAAGGKTVNEVLKNIVNRNYCPFKHRFLKGKLSNDLKAIFEKAVCPVPAQRYKSAHVMAEDLKLYLMREETAARPDNIFRKCTRAMINHKLITSLVILIILLCLSASTIYSLQSQNNLMKEQRVREAMLTNFQGSVALQGHAMERILHNFRIQLDNLSYQAGRLLGGKVIEDGRAYLMKDYLKASTAPPDYLYSPAYKQKISLDYPAFKLGRSVKLTDDTSRRIIALSPMFKHIMFESDPVLKDKTEKAAKNIIINKGVTLSWVYVGLKNGSILCYPGGNIYSQQYDPRKRPWYKRALTQKKRALWSKPYKDAFSSNIVMSCTKCIYDDKGIFQGIAGMDIRLDYIRERMFGNKSIPGLKEYLLSKKYRIILSSDFKNDHVKTYKDKSTLILKRFPFERELHEAIEKGRVQFEAVRHNTKYILALYKFPIGHYYIQQVSEKSLRKAWDENISHKDKQIIIADKY